MLDFESFPIATLLLTDPEYFPAILEYAKEDKPIKWDSWLLFYFEADAILHDLRSFDCNFNLDNEPKLRKKFDRFLSSFSTSFPHKNQIGNGVNASPFSRTIFDAICRLHDLRIPLVAALAPLVAIIASEIVIKCTKW